MGKAAKTRFSYHLTGGEAGPCPDPDLLAGTIKSAFQSLRRPECLVLAVPATQDSPPCADPGFRRFAQRLLILAPGLPFFIFGGGADISREIFLAQLANLQSARDQHGRVVVTYPVEEAQALICCHYQALYALGLSEKETTAVFTPLSRNCGMGADLWK